MNRRGLASLATGLYAFVGGATLMGVVMSTQATWLRIVLAGVGLFCVWLAWVFGSWDEDE